MSLENMLKIHDKFKYYTDESVINDDCLYLLYSLVYDCTVYLHRFFLPDCDSIQSWERLPVLTIVWYVIIMILVNFPHVLFSTSLVPDKNISKTYEKYY